MQVQSFLPQRPPLLNNNLPYVTLLYYFLL